MKFLSVGLAVEQCAVLQAVVLALHAISPPEGAARPSRLWRGCESTLGHWNLPLADPIFELPEVAVEVVGV